MSRCVVNVATGPYLKGQTRLMNSFAKFGSYGFSASTWPAIPAVWPSHEQRPYAFKCFALKEVSEYHDTLLWADACILPIRSLKPLWERIERDGYWFSANGYTNYEWTADSAYPDLFRPEWEHAMEDKHMTQDRIMEDLRALNKTIPHVVATTFGISLKHEIGRAFLAEYFRLASETRAFCGPWINASSPDWLSQPGAQERTCANGRVSVCGPLDVRGHRHDQTAASVIAWRLGMKLTEPPDIFAYGRAGDANIDPRTILLADGSY